MTEMHHDPLGDIPEELRPVFDGPRRRYRNVSPPPVAPMLSAFMAMGLTNDKGDLPVTAASNANEPAAQAVGLPNWRTTLRSNKERVMSTIAAFIGTTIGKVVLGTAVAAASVGTGQAVGVLDVPGLPNGTTAPVVETEHDEADDDAAEAPHCSDQADAIEEAAEGQGDAAEEAASEEADAFEDACEEADEAAEDAESADAADDDAETDEVDEVDEVETDDDADEVDEVETDDDADEVETDDDADEVETDDDADDADEVDEVETDDDDVDEADDDAHEVETDEVETEELDADDDESDDTDD